MAQKTKAELKAYFETGDVPTQSQFSDFIESYPNLTDLSVSETEFGYLDGVTSNLQTQIDGKQDELTGLTASVTELNYTDGVTSNIQTQLDAKADLSGATFTNTIEVNNNTPVFRLNDGNAVSDNKKTNISSSDGALRIQHLNDSDAGGGDYAEFNRSGNQMTNFSLLDNAVAKIVLSNNGKISATSSTSGTGVDFTHSGTGNAVVITKTNSGDALDVVSGTVRIQGLTADRWLFIDSQNRVTVKTNAELLTAIGAITEVSEDTTPQLGGNLDGQSNNITNLNELNCSSIISSSLESSTADIDTTLTADNIEVGNGATGSFTTTDGKTVTVTAGIITNIV